MKKPPLTPPLYRLIKIDPTVTLQMLSTPPGNPGGLPTAPPREVRKRHKPFEHDGWESPFERLND